MFSIRRTGSFYRYKIRDIEHLYNVIYHFPWSFYINPL